MSVNDDFDVMHEAGLVRNTIAGLDYVESVSAPQIKNGAKGQYVSLGVNFTDDVENPDVRLEHELQTVVSHAENVEDCWTSYDMTGFFGAINTFGLNPNPQ